MMANTILVWFRRDLRLRDNPALQFAVQKGAVTIPVYIYAPDEETPWPPGAASCWWLHHSLASLNEGLCKRGSRLILRSGPTDIALQRLITETGARAIYLNRLYEPAVARRDARLRARFLHSGIEWKVFDSALLHEPDSVLTRSGKPYRVFTAFWKAARQHRLPNNALSAAPARLASVPLHLGSQHLHGLELLPKTQWNVPLSRHWTPGERAGLARLREFCRTGLAAYADSRDFPALDATSRLSPHLHFGELSPYRVRFEVLAQDSSALGQLSTAAEQYIRQLYWREFAHYQLTHFPETPENPFDVRFRQFPWSVQRSTLVAWQRGSTGYPLVDAGMRQLWQTGWMHNRVRMVCASLLVKNLRQDWREGTRWFWDTLLDADLANNTIGWQWTAGCGVDAAPFFRVFNPTRQGQRFDPAGDYVRRWIPALARLPAKWIHEPASAPHSILRSAGVILGENYPRPIVNFRVSREAAIAAFLRLNKSDNRNSHR